MSEMYEINVEYSFTLTDEDIEDIIVTALEGGIGYWCCLDNTPKAFEDAPDDEPTAITAFKILISGGSLRLIDEVENHEMHFMDLECLLNGIKTWEENGYDFYNVISPNKGVGICNLDAEAADGIIQCAIFGDIIYG